MFDKFVGVLYHLAKSPEGLTAGELARRTGSYSKGQVERLLNDLQKGRYVAAEMQPHGRTGKRVFGLTQRGRKDLRELAALTLEKAVQL